jgi:quinol monooxygenase YgiN
MVIGLCAALVPSPAALAADEPVVLISRFFVNPGQEAVFEQRTLKAVEFVRKAEPEVIYRLQRSITNPLQYVFYEVYPSQAALDRHMKETLPAFAKEVGPRPEGMLARPPENEKLVPLGR